MNDYREMLKALRSCQHIASNCIDCPLSNTKHYNPKTHECEVHLHNIASDAIEQLVREINYCPTDTLRKYHAWLLEQFHNNPTSEILHSIDTAIGWLKAYAEYRDINVSFGVGNGEVCRNDIRRSNKAH